MIIPSVDRFKYVGVSPFATPFLAEAVSGAGRVYKEGSSPQITTLDNGLTIITENKPGVYSAGVNLFVNVGSAYENENNWGATHFLEHMVFKRTKNKTGKQIAEEAENSGASINAATSDEHTYYHTQALGEKILIPTLVYLDMLLNNRMHEKEFAIEKGVILEEAKGYEDEPTERVQILAQETYFKGHPYGKRIIGTQDTISAMQRSDLKRFLHDYYTPDNMFLSLSGHIDADKLIKEIDKFTSHVDRKARKQKLPPVTYNVESAVDEMDVQQAHVILMMPGYSLLDDKKYAAMVLNMVLGGGLSSRLFRNVRDKTGYCYTVQSIVDASSFGGAFMVYSGLKKDKVQEGVNLILKELAKVKKHGLKSYELERAKTQIRTALTIKEESTKASSYGNGMNYMFKGEIDSIEEVDRKIRAVTNEDIMQVANEMFDPKFIAYYVVGPKDAISKPVEISFL